MYVDETIIAGLLAVMGTLGFLAGFGWIVYRDMHKAREKQ